MATSSILGGTRLPEEASGNDAVVNTGAYRANLHYRVEQVSSEADKLARVLALAQASSGSGLVYTATVKVAEAVWQALEAAGESALRYHGKLGPAARQAAQEAFMRGEARIMVATNAFGLGIDKPDIRFVLHHQMPPGLHAYYQASGRAGRDGQEAVCTLLFLRSDKAVQQFFMSGPSGRYPGADDVEALYRALQQDPPDVPRIEGWPLAAMQRSLGRPLNKLKLAASLLRRQRVAAFNTKGHVYLLKRHLDEAGLQALMAAYGSKREQDQAGLEAMVFYAQTGQCRWRLLLAQLQAQDGFASCGSCDNCRRIAALEAELADRARETVKALPGGSTAGEVDNVPTPTPAAFLPEDTVQVRRYGQGRVVAADVLSVTVEFASGQQRSFQADYVQRVAPRRQAGARPAA